MSDIRGLVTKISIKADAQGNAPAEIELLRTGDWNTLWHGDFEITLADLYEYAANFAKGIGLVEGDKRCPVNYAHDSWDKAAGWITALRIDDSRQALVASVEWTPEGEKALRDKEWAYISPEFNPRGSFPYQDPEGSEDADGIPEFVANVLTGAALTNVPLFKKLKPIMASRVPSKPKKANVTSGDGNKPNREGESMNLEDIRKKQAADLTADEKTFLTDHKAELTDDERTTFGLVEDDADAKAKADKEAADKAAAEQADKDKAEADAKAAEEASKVEASRKGQVSISASELASLKASAERADKLAAEIDRNKATATVKASIKAGQIKSGDQEKWVNQLLASSETGRKDLETLLAGLPKNEQIGKELGDQGKDVAIENEIDARVNAAVKDSGGKLTYTAAFKQVMASDKEFRERIDTERNQANG